MTERTIWLGGIFLFFAGLSSATAETRQLVFLHSYGRHFSPYEVYASKLRAKLAQESSEPIDIYEVDLSTARSVEGEREDLFVEFLKSLFENKLAAGASISRLVRR